MLAKTLRLAALPLVFLGCGVAADNRAIDDPLGPEDLVAGKGDLITGAGDAGSVSCPMRQVPAGPGMVLDPNKVQTVALKFLPSRFRETNAYRLKVQGDVEAEMENWVMSLTFEGGSGGLWVKDIDADAWAYHAYSASGTSPARVDVELARSTTYEIYAYAYNPGATSVTRKVSYSCASAPRLDVGLGRTPDNVSIFASDLFQDTDKVFVGTNLIASSTRRLANPRFRYRWQKKLYNTWIDFTDNTAEVLGIAGGFDDLWPDGVGRPVTAVDTCDWSENCCLIGARGDEKCAYAIDPEGEFTIESSSRQGSTDDLVAVKAPPAEGTYRLVLRYRDQPFEGGSPVVHEVTSIPLYYGAKSVIRRTFTPDCDPTDATRSCRSKVAGKPLEMTAVDGFAVVLQENASTGCHWQVEAPYGLSYNVEYKRGQLIGAPGTATFTFESFPYIENEGTVTFKYLGPAGTLLDEYQVRYISYPYGPTCGGGWVVKSCPASAPRCVYDGNYPDATGFCAPALPDSDPV